MMSDDDQLSHYLSEIYKNLNIITANIMEVEYEQVDLDNDEVIKSIESRFNEWMGSFYNIIVYLFCTTVAFLISVINISYRPMAIAMFSLFPFYLWFTFFYSIPEIRIQGNVVFSRKDLTLRKQLQLARSLFAFFMRQLYTNSKKGIFISLIFLALLCWNVLLMYF